ncbi:MAG: C69 family dipeptidase [Lentimicrobiaceae bacterium]|jgi:dipeptidase|nr:C69 family dipeptidase [Lentimicrobiaceae bacterium]
MRRILTALFLVGFLFQINNANACTNYLITKGASADGSTIVSYAADSHVLYGELYHWEAGVWPKGTMMDIYEWDTGKFLGQIEQAEKTYNVVGNMNEHQVIIGETTYGGRPELVDTTGVIDYGSLIYITLQRATSAREAIKIIAELTDKYGYYSSGESFSILDKDEVWILELIGKGTNLNKKGENLNKGMVWVARLVPDGYVCGHANQARITTFPLANGKTSITSKELNKIMNPEVETVYSHDVMTFARSKGWFTGQDKNFSFSDTYAPVDFSAARASEIRVWTMFNEVVSDMDKYWEYVKGNIENNATFADGTPNPDGYATNRMPLWVKPEKKVSIHDVMMYMRNYLNGTELDMSKDLGAGSFGLPYRWRPLTWKVDDIEYVNERATATQQTGFSFVAQARNWLPNEIGGIIWWGVDDANACVYMPMYCCITKIPYNFRRGNGSMMEWSETSGFWITNLISNFAYTRYNVIQPDVEIVRDRLEKQFLEQTDATDKEALKRYKESPKKAVAFLTEYSSEQGAYTFNTYKKLYQDLFMKYMDGNIKTAVEGQRNPNVKQPGYDERTLRLIVEDHGNQLRVPDKK